jgi:hypothetical protein
VYDRMRHKATDKCHVSEEVFRKKKATDEMSFVNGWSIGARGLVGLLLRAIPLLLHFLPQAQRAHVDPHFLDVVQTLLLGAGLARILSTEGILAIGGPDGILRLVVDDDFVDRGVFLFIAHGSFPFCQRCLAVGGGCGFGRAWRKSQSCCF